MSELVSRADFMPVTSSAGNGDDRGAAIRRRIDTLGISDREWHTQTGIDRKTLHRAIRNEPGTRASTYTAIEAELEKLEAKVAGRAIVAPASEKPNVVRIEVQNVYGTRALVVEGPISDRLELEEMVDRIMRRRAAEEGDPDAARERSTDE